jgi:hypothetical protein
MNPAPSVGSAISVAASWSTILVAAAFVSLPSRNPLMISQSVPWTAMLSQRAARVPARSSVIVVPPRTLAQARTGFAVVASDPAAGLVASESGDLFDLDEFDDLDPGQVDRRRQGRVLADPRQELSDDLGRRHASVAGGETLQDGQGAGASEVAQRCVVEDENSHDNGSKSRRSESSGTARCSGRSASETVPQSRSTVLDAESLPLP